MSRRPTHPDLLFKQLPEDERVCLQMIRSYGGLLYEAEEQGDVQMVEMVEDLLSHLRYRYYKLQDKIDFEGLAFCTYYEQEYPELQYIRKKKESTRVCTPVEHHITWEEVEELDEIVAHPLRVIVEVQSLCAPAKVHSVVTSEAVEVTEDSVAIGCSKTCVRVELHELGATQPDGPPHVVSLCVCTSVLQYKCVECCGYLARHASTLMHVASTCNVRVTIPFDAELMLSKKVYRIGTFRALMLGLHGITVSGTARRLCYTRLEKRPTVSSLFQMALRACGRDVIK